MFDIGFMELCLIGLVALLVVGPERLPRLARSVGLWMAKARRFMADVKSDIKAEMEEQDLAALKDIKSDLEEARDELNQAGSSMSQALSDEQLMDHIETPAELAAQTENYVRKKKSPTGQPRRSKAAKPVKRKKKTSSAKQAVKKKTPKRKKPVTVRQASGKSNKGRRKVSK